MKLKRSILFWLLAIGLVAAVPSQANTVASFSASSEEEGTVSGVVYDRETSEPLGHAYLFIEELNRSTISHADGTFEFRNVPEGTYTLIVQRLGYRTVNQTIEVEADEATHLEITVQPTVMSSESIEVIGEAESSRSSLEHASKSISGTQLRQGLGNTLSKTLEELAGFDSRTMGGATARPVMRGLGGERVLLLQDGERTGDVSSQSPDHAVTVDPMAAEEIEIARGPAALIYGSNAIGGVVNVVRNQISNSVPDHIHGTGSLQGESVNRGGVGALEANIPLGDFVIQADGNFRSAGNIRTPAGTLSNSDVRSTNNAVGLSYVRPWGYAGLASSVYLNSYGIPPDPDGGHAEGVDINMEKYQFESSAEFYIEDSAFRSVTTDISHKSYFHEEVEPGGTLGTEFGVLTTNGSVKARHDEIGFLDEGTVGVWGEAKDYAVNGANTPDSDAYSLAAFVVEEKDIGDLHLEAGLRYDFVSNRPDRENPDSRIGHIRQRNFDALASSISAIYDLGKGYHLGTTLIHSFRAPSQEELFSEGPHLASYSYEIGNPDLDAERGLGKELFLRHRSDPLNAEFAVYHNGFSNYIYPRNTGQSNPRFPSLNDYQFEGAPATLYGFEASAEVQIGSRLALSGSSSYTIGDRDLTDRERELNPETNKTQPLPMIPPLKGKVSLTYSNGGFRLGARTRLAAEQSRTGDFEEPTDGYILFDVFGQYRFDTGGVLHSIALNTENIFNTEYRSHLSRIKELNPEPGINASLLYRVYF